MGWTHEMYPRHEGYLQGIEQRTDRPGHWRDFDLSDEARARDGSGIMLTHVQVACDCGWRSQRIAAPTGTRYVPFSVVLSGWHEERFEEAARTLWNAHLASQWNAELYKLPPADASL